MAMKRKINFFVFYKFSAKFIERVKSFNSIPGAIMGVILIPKSPSKEYRIFRVVTVSSAAQVISSHCL